MLCNFAGQYHGDRVAASPRPCTIALASQLSLRYPALHCGSWYVPRPAERVPHALRVAVPPYRVSPFTSETCSVECQSDPTPHCTKHHATPHKTDHTQGTQTHTFDTTHIHAHTHISHLTYTHDTQTAHDSARQHTTPRYCTTPHESTQSTTQKTHNTQNTKYTQDTDYTQHSASVVLLLALASQEERRIEDPPFHPESGPSTESALSPV